MTIQNDGVRLGLKVVITFFLNFSLSRNCYYYKEMWLQWLVWNSITFHSIVHACHKYAMPPGDSVDVTSEQNLNQNLKLHYSLDVILHFFSGRWLSYLPSFVSVMLILGLGNTYRWKNMRSLLIACYNTIWLFLTLLMILVILTASVCVQLLISWMNDCRLFLDTPCHRVSSWWCCWSWRYDMVFGKCSIISSSDLTLYSLL